MISLGTVRQSNKSTACLHGWGMWSFFPFYFFPHSALMHVDILHSILQKWTMDPLKARQALENLSCSMPELKDKLTTDDTQPHPDADTAVAAAMLPRMWQSANVSVATQCLIKESKAHSEGFYCLLNLLNLNCFCCLRPSFPWKQLHIGSEHFTMICKEKLKAELRMMYRNEYGVCMV